MIPKSKTVIWMMSCSDDDDVTYGQLFALIAA